MFHPHIRTHTSQWTCNHHQDPQRIHQQSWSSIRTPNSPRLRNSDHQRCKIIVLRNRAPQREWASGVVTCLPVLLFMRWWWCQHHNDNCVVPALIVRLCGVRPNCRQNVSTGPDFVRRFQGVVKCEIPEMLHSEQWHRMVQGVVVGTFDEQQARRNDNNHIMAIRVSTRISKLGRTKFSMNKENNYTKILINEFQIKEWRVNCIPHFLKFWGRGCNYYIKQGK